MVPRAHLPWPEPGRERVHEALRGAVADPGSLIHVPLPAQPGLPSTLATSLVVGGTLLLVAGSRAWNGSEHDWLGGARGMWWSHADTCTYRTWLTDAGFAITQEDFVPEGSSGHSLFWALRRRS